MSESKTRLTMIHRNASLTLIQRSPSGEKPRTYTGETVQIMIGGPPSSGAELATARPKFVVRWHHADPTALSGATAVRIEEGGRTLVEGTFDQKSGAAWINPDWVQFLVF